VPPLKNLDFLIYGIGKTLKEELKIKILKLGGRVSTKVVPMLAAVISTEEETKTSSSTMQSIQSNDIQVVLPSFLDDVKSNFAISDTLNLIQEKNIVTWGSNVSYTCDFCILFRFHVKNDFLCSLTIESQRT
jgi:poly [ADP-ribose] polymerase 1